MTYTIYITLRKYILFKIFADDPCLKEQIQTNYDSIVSGLDSSQLILDAMLKHQVIGIETVEEMTKLDNQRKRACALVDFVLNSRNSKCCQIFMKCIELNHPEIGNAMCGNQGISGAHVLSADQTTCGDDVSSYTGQCASANLEGRLKLYFKKLRL